MERDNAFAQTQSMIAERDGYKAAFEVVTAEQAAALALLERLSKEFEQTQSLADRMTSERDASLTASQVLAAERDGYHAAYLAVSAERDAATARHLTTDGEKNGFEAAYLAVSAERDAATARHITADGEKNGFEAAYLAVSAVRDASLADLQNTRIERDGFRAAYETVSADRDRATASMQTAIGERNGFEAAFSRVSYQLTTSVNRLGLVNSGVTAGALEPGRRSRPPMLIITLPKSGTVYLQTKLSRGLDLQVGRVCSGAFGRDLINYALLDAFSHGNAIATSHLDPSLENLTMLKAKGVRFVCHVRDPRGATLSMLHHILRYHADPHLRPLLALIGPEQPSADFYNSSLHDQIDWMIDHYLPRAVHWIEAWQYAFDSNSFVATHGLSTSYDDLTEEPDRLVERILRHYSIDELDFRDVAVSRDMSSHFRRGDDHEWREVFSPEQIARATKYIPSHLLRKFGWPDQELVGQQAFLDAELRSFATHPPRITAQ